MDREKVIKGYMICVEHGLLNGKNCHGYHQWKDNHYEIEKINDYSKGCPYNGCETGCVKTLAKDTLSLLKEQEAKTGHWIYLQYCANEGVYCSECHTKMFDRYPMKKKLSQFCGHCGAKMEEKVK